MGHPVVVNSQVRPQGTCPQPEWAEGLQHRGMGSQSNRGAEAKRQAKMVESRWNSDGLQAMSTAIIMEGDRLIVNTVYSNIQRCSGWVST